MLTCNYLPLGGNVHFAARRLGASAGREFDHLVKKMEPIHAGVSTRQ